MKRLLALCARLLTGPFYSRNTGFLFFLFVVLVAMVPDPLAYHYTLMRQLPQGYGTLFTFFACWVLYQLRCAGFLAARFRQPGYALLGNLLCLPTARRISLLLLLYLSVLLPILLYAGLCVLVCLQLHAWGTAATILLFFVVSSMAGTAWLLRLLRPGGVRVVQFRLPLPVQYNTLLLLLSLRKGKRKLLVIKCFSFIALAIMLVWNRDHFRFSDFVFFFQAAVAAHALLIFDYTRFLEKGFPLLRNLPLPLHRRWLQWTFTCLVLLLPELAFLAYGQVLTGAGPQLYVLWLLGVTELLLLVALCYEQQMEADTYLMYSIVVLLAALLLPLFTGFALAIAGFALAASVLFFRLYEAGDPPLS